MNSGANPRTAPIPMPRAIVIVSPRTDHEHPLARDNVLGRTRDYVNERQNRSVVRRQALERATSE
jgi:hypothetical protein